MASLEKLLGKTKEIEETVRKMKKLQDGSPGKIVEHRGKHIEKKKDLNLNGARGLRWGSEQDGLQGDEE